jgi:hypothetical protein
MKDSALGFGSTRRMIGRDCIVSGPPLHRCCWEPRTRRGVYSLPQTSTHKSREGPCPSRRLSCVHLRCAIWPQFKFRLESTRSSFLSRKRYSFEVVKVHSAVGVCIYQTRESNNLNYSAQTYKVKLESGFAEWHRGFEVEMDP